MEFICRESTEIKRNSVNCVENCPDTDFLELRLDNQPEKVITLVDNTEEPLPGTDVLSYYRRCITDLPAALISEILNCLDPKELGIVSCVSTILHKVASEHHVWKKFYCERWGLPTTPTPPPSSEIPDEKSWRELFVERDFRSKTFLGRCSLDVLHGHIEAIRTVFLLPSAKLIFSSGYDCVVRMWDLEEGSSIAASSPLGCTIRAVTADKKLLAAGGTDGFIHFWKSVDGNPHLFDLRGSDSGFRVWEHEGPISSLALDMNRIYSGSWDMTVHVLDRSTFKCLHILKHTDWVYRVVPHDITIVSTCGSDVYVWDTITGNLMTVILDAHVGNVCALARSHGGNFIFTGGEDGAIHMFEITVNGNEAAVLLIAKWIPHSSTVHSLAFEFPWLVSAASDGKLALIDVRKLVRARASNNALEKRVSRIYQVKNRNSVVEPPQRMLHGHECNLFSVGIGADRIVCGGEEGNVRIWNFTRALEFAEKARSLRGIRLENRMRRRKLQLEMNGKGGRIDQCSVSAKKNSTNGVWHKQRRVNGKVKA
ncbi:F-box/WD-40 repeat-containing protein At5g21040-like [Rutidosis leptorrhynchoides]|uniref:F-box/WD-40 repeat-containing protein At5g21040-like n=1 Tax=Rutidosis leptorrhynchoides TaxID=125765 RepID=UPI003A9A3468